MLFMLAAAPYAQNANEGAKAETTAFDFPKNREGEVAAAFIEAFSSGSEENLSAFMAKFGSEAWQAKGSEEVYSYKRMHQLLGSLLPHSIVESKDADIVVLVRSKSIGAYFSVGLTLDEGTPRMLDDHFIRPAARPGG